MNGLGRPESPAVPGAHSDRRLRAGRATERTSNRRGFTLVELLIALAIGVIVLTTATSVASSMFKNVGGVRVRESVSRQARFVGMSLERDLSETGVELESDISFGSLAARGDTLSIISVPFTPDIAPVYRLVAAVDTAPLLPSGEGSCGIRCLNLRAPRNGDPVELEAGDVALLNAAGSRRLMIVDDISPITDSTRVKMVDMDSLLFRPANFAGGLRLPRGLTSVQRLQAVTYYLENGTLMRAERFKPDGTLDGAPMADGVDSFTVRLIFTDGHEAAQANGTDADTENDYDDIVSVIVRLRLRADSTGVNKPADGIPLTRAYEWRFSPRNLIYERNRRR